MVHLRRGAFLEGVPPPLRPVLSLVVDGDAEFDADDGTASGEVEQDRPDDGVAAAG